MHLLFLAALAFSSDPIELATTAMAEGRPAAALPILRRALADDPRHEARCLYGRAALRAGQAREALDALRSVPDDAPCGRVAAGLRADALAALGRLDEAAAAWAALGDRALGPDRHKDSADRLVGWAERAAVDRPEEARSLLGAALQLEIGAPRRREIARRLAKLGDPTAADVLVSAIARGEDVPDDRLLLAPLLDPTEGLALLAGEPDTAEVMAARARIVADDLRGIVLARALIARFPDSDEAAAVRLDVGLRAAARGEVEEAGQLLGPVAVGASADLSGVERAAVALAELAARIGTSDAEERIATALARYPATAERRALEAARDRLRLDAVRRAADPVALRALADARPEDGALALEAALALAGADRLERLTEVAARWPGATVGRQALRARVTLDPEGGWTWLEAQVKAGRSGAAAVRAELAEPGLLIRSPGRQARDPEVVLAVRGVDKVEMRLHRIDLEGFVRGGRSPEDLEGLDVGIIAPDKTWTADLGAAQPGVEREVKVALPIRAPGLYAVTAALPDREARTFVLVSDVELIARTVSGELLAVAVRGGAPVPGARVIAVGGRVSEGRADKTGLARLPIDAGRVVVLADTPAGPAMLAIESDVRPAPAALATAIDLDRPVYLPGDTARFRAVATRGGEIVRGRWRFELRGAVTHAVLRVETDAWGAAVGAVTLPDSAAAGAYTLWALVPGEDAPRRLADLRVERDGPLAHRLRADTERADPHLELLDGAGVPVAGAVVLVQDLDGADRRVATDGRGRAPLATLPPGAPPIATARLPLSAVEVRGAVAQDSPSLSWDRTPSLAAAGRPIAATLRGDATDAIVWIQRIVPQPEAAAPLAAPTPFQERPLSAFEPLVDSTGAARARVTLFELPVAVGAEATTIALPELAPGRYAIRAVRADGRASTELAVFDVREGPTVRVEAAPVVGGTGAFGVTDGVAIVTAENGGLLGAAVVRARQPWRTPIDARWHGDVEVVATTLDGASRERLRLDAALKVSLDVAVGDAWRVSGAVADASGSGRRAQVLVRAIDAALIEERGAPRTVGLWPFLARREGSSFAAVARTLVGASASTPISGALLAEAARVRERDKALAAKEGRLARNDLAGLLDEDFAPEAEGLGGLGLMGSGRGGGGSARHIGSGGYGRGAGGVAQPALQTPHGYRGVGAWRIVETDARGAFDVALPAPPAGRSWRVEAIALGAGSVGQASQTVAPPDAPRLVLDPLQPGWLGDEARPRARVIAGSTAVEVVVRVDGAADTALKLGPGEAGAVALPPLAAGAGREVALLVDGREVARSRIAFPLAPGLPSDDGDVSVAIVGRPGGTLLGALALEDDPWGDAPLRRAAAGLGLAVAIPTLRGEERAVATARLAAIVGATREGPPHRDPVLTAASLHLLAVAAPILDLPRADVAEAVERYAAVEPRTARERLDLTFARALAVGSAPEATLGRLVREADQLDDEGRARLVRLLALVGEAPRPEWITGDGPEARLASVAVRGVAGPTAERALAVTPPPLGDPARATWIEAVAPALARPSDPSRATPTGFVRSATPLDGAPGWRERAPHDSSDLHMGGAGTPTRAPAGADGLPMSGVGSGVRCGTRADPCRIAVGEGVVPPSGAPVAQGGLAPVPNQRLVVATTPGTYRLVLAPAPPGAPSAALHVVVGGDSDPTPLGEAARVQAATLAEARGLDPREALGAAPLGTWEQRLRPTVARLRFASADPGDPAAYIAAFEDLRDEAPSTAIALEAVAETARAYRDAGRPDRSIALWQRAIGQDTLAELGVGGHLEQVYGRLAAIQALREATRRAPSVPAVQQAAFALPDRLLALADDLPAQALEAGVTPTDVRLQAAAWDREYLAWFPDSSDAPEAGLRLATTLYELGARQGSLAWSERMRARHPDHALVDRWLLLDGVARTELGQGRDAERVFRRLADEELPLGGGRVGPSALRDDARYGLGRLAEARDDVKEALRWYEAASGAVPEASSARAALSVVSVRTEALARGPASGPTKIEITASNLDEVLVSAYAIDLRTLFLRETGIPRPGTLRVEGLAPVFSATRKVGAGPFPTRSELALPLSGPGAWLVRVDGEGASAATLVVRSDLELGTTDTGDRRVAARLSGRPRPGAGVRALVGAEAVAVETDARGVAVVPNGAPTLVWWEGHYAFTADAVAGAAPVRPAPRRPAPAQDVLQQRLQQREKSRRSSNIQTYDFIGNEVEGELRVDDL